LNDLERVLGELDIAAGGTGGEKQCGEETDNLHFVAPLGYSILLFRLVSGSATNGR
jgi:hypothetical protein